MKASNYYRPEKSGRSLEEIMKEELRTCESCDHFKGGDCRIDPPKIIDFILKSEQSSNNTWEKDIEISTRYPRPIATEPACGKWKE